MKKTQKTLISSAVVAATVVALAPYMALAQEQTAPVPALRPAVIRQVNLDRNRDIRNETMKQRSAASVAPAAPVAQAAQTVFAARVIVAPGRIPAWLTASTTTPWMRTMSSATLKSLQKTASTYASTTPPNGHENWKKARLDVFTWMQSRLLAETQQSLGSLKELRLRIAEKIQISSQQGYDMTLPAQVLVIADQKIASADAAIAAIAAITPSFVATSTTARIETSTEVSLDGPRETGKAAIQALGDARKALNDVIIAIARVIGPADKTATTTQQ